MGSWQWKVWAVGRPGQHNVAVVHATLETLERRALEQAVVKSTQTVLGNGLGDEAPGDAPSVQFLVQPIDQVGSAASAEVSSSPSPEPRDPELSPVALSLFLFPPQPFLPSLRSTTRELSSSPRVATTAAVAAAAAVVPAPPTYSHRATRGARGPAQTRPHTHTFTLGRCRSE